MLLVGVPPSADAFVHLAGRTARCGEAGQVVVVCTRADAARQLGSLAAQLDLQLDATHLEGEDERWAQMWRVHEKVVRAEAKGWA